MPKLKVLHIMRCLDMGGIGVFAMNICRQCEKEDVRFDFAIAYDSYGDFGQEIVDRGGKIYYLSKEGNRGVKDAVKQIIELNRILHKEKYDVVHCHYYFANAIFLFIAKINGVKKRVSHCHNVRTQKVSCIRKVVESFLKLVLSAVATDMIGCSDAATSFLYRKKDIKKGKAFTVYNGIDYQKWDINHYDKAEMRKKYGIIAGKINFVFVGRLAEQKNPMFMLEVFGKIKDIQKESFLTIIGYGALKPILETKVIELGLKNDVTFLDKDTNVVEVMSVMDYMLAPSLWEGLPIAFIEAQAMNTVVFTSNSIPEEVDMGLCEFLELDMDIWKERILSFIKEETSKKVSLEKKKLFDVKNTTRKILSVYTGSR